MTTSPPGADPSPRPRPRACGHPSPAASDAPRLVAPVPVRLGPTPERTGDTTARLASDTAPHTAPHTAVDTALDTALDTAVDTAVDLTSPVWTVRHVAAAPFVSLDAACTLVAGSGFPLPRDGFGADLWLREHVLAWFAGLPPRSQGHSPTVHPQTGAMSKPTSDDNARQTVATLGPHRPGTRPGTRPGARPYRPRRTS